MASRLRKLVRNAARKAGYELVKVGPGPTGAELRQAFEETVAETFERVRPYTMTSPERIDAVCRGAAHVVEHRIPGAFVECGVWRGGSTMAAALTLLRLGDAERDLYLFDTYEGMPPPTAEDVTARGKSAAEEWRERAGDADISAWCNAPLDDVRKNLTGTGYPAARLHFVKGKVEETIPGEAPERIALLRLDTDWYESTRHELEHLYPRLQPGGILIIDDYGHWQGARQAVDEYLKRLKIRLFLHRIDYTGRIAVKP